MPRRPSLSALPTLLRTALLFTLLFTGALFAQEGEPAPLTLAYQGYLSDLAGEPINEERGVTFRLYAQGAGVERRLTVSISFRTLV